MGLRFRKSFKVAPGVKVNLNKKSAGVTIGTKGAHYTVNTSGKRTASVGLPGTGLSYSTSLGGGKKGTKRKPTKKDTFNKVIGIVIAIVAIVCTAGAIKNAMDKKAVSTPAAITTQADAQTTGSAASSNTSSAIASGSSGTAADTAQSTVWISASGKKYHSRSDCSSMENATEITLQEALDMGKEACKRCNP